MKKILSLAVILVILSSCQRNVSPYQAANRGDLKCNKHRLR